MTIHVIFIPTKEKNLILRQLLPHRNYLLSDTLSDQSFQLAKMTSGEGNKKKEKHATKATKNKSTENEQDAKDDTK